jgi:hypothetical protein
MDHGGSWPGLERIARDAYDRMVGLNAGDLAVDGYITKAPCGGEAAGCSPVDSSKRVLEAFGGQRRRRDPAGAGSSHPSALMTRRCWHPPWNLLPGWCHCPNRPRCTWTRATTAGKPHTTLAERGLDGHIAHKGTPASIPGRQLGLVERVHACGAPLASSAGTRSGLRVVDFYLTLAHAIPIVRRLVRRACTYPRRHVVDIVQAAVVGLARQIRTADAQDR